MFKLAKKLLIVLVVSVLMISMVTATAYAVSTQKSVDKKDTGIVKIESKEKTTKYKITWNGNGGKIGTKKTVTTTVKKGSKINKLVRPTRSGYSFKGWYTKKTGGKKISENTKPSRTVSYFAHWRKNSNSGTAKSSIVGKWEYIFDYTYYFAKDGSFSYISSSGWSSSLVGYYRSINTVKGKYTTSNGKVYLTKLSLLNSMGDSKKLKNQNLAYSLGTDKDGKYLSIPQFEFIPAGSNNLPTHPPMKFRSKPWSNQ